ncbi:MAG: hypothetical protein JXB39_04515 [Deltaproteobacteria bacterium]|nr:hypothetical protein [Deltaproteobacteria bacterium]
MPTPLLFAVALAAHAGDLPPVPAVAPVEAPDADPAVDALPPYASVLRLAHDLRAANDPDAARATLDWLLGQPLPPEVAGQARALHDALPAPHERLEATARLAAWQGALGGYLLGPHLVRLTWDPNREATPYFVGAAAGALAGAGSAVWLGRHGGLDPGQATAAMTAQALGGWNGAAIGHLLAPDGDRGWGAGLMTGVGVGAAAGTVLLLREPTRAESLGAASGSVWGLGLGLAGWLVATDGNDSGALVPLLVGSDLGAVAGLALARTLHAPPERIWLVDLGGAAGAAAGFMLLLILDEVADFYDPAGQTLVVAGTTVAGGVLGGVLGRRRAPRDVPVAASLLSGHPGALRVAVPVPSPGPDRAGHLSLVDMRF